MWLYCIVSLLIIFVVPILRNSIGMILLKIIIHIFSYLWLAYRKLILLCNPKKGKIRQLRTPSPKKKLKQHHLHTENCLHCQSRSAYKSK